MLGKLLGRTMDSRFRGNDKKGLEKADLPICATPYYSFCLLTFYETNGRALKAWTTVEALHHSVLGHSLCRFVIPA